MTLAEISSSTVFDRSGVGPPLAKIFQIDLMRRRREDKRASIEHVGERAGIVLWIGWNFGKSPVAGGADGIKSLGEKTNSALPKPRCPTAKRAPALPRPQR